MSARDPDLPVAEGAAGDLWCVAYPSSDGGVDVYAYRYQRRGEAVVTTACLYAGHVRRGRWACEIGDPHPRALRAVREWAARVCGEREEDHG